MQRMASTIVDQLHSSLSVALDEGETKRNQQTLAKYQEAYEKANVFKKIQANRDYLDVQEAQEIAAAQKKR